MNMKRREFITLLGGATAAWPVAAWAQQGDRIRRIGVLLGYDEADPEGQRYIAAFLMGVQVLGWAPGHNVQIDYRWAAADPVRIRTYAAELVGLKPDLILANSGLVVAPLQQQTQTIPIIFTQINDPVGSGFVSSLARPGGNVTGFTPGEFSMYGKFPEMLKQIAPGVTQAAVVLNLDQTPQLGMWRAIEAVAPSLGVRVVQANVHDAAEINGAIEAFARVPNGGLVVLANPIVNLHRDLIIGLAARYHLPAVYAYRYFVAEGGLMSYGVDPIDLYRRSASYADRILRGEKVGNLPVQQPTKFELVINLKTAKALGLTVSNQMQLLADEVIE
jgi:putative ABC transport system substrate-binding protein